MCIWSDVKVLYTDGKWREFKIIFNPRENTYSLPYLLKYTKYFGRKVDAIKIAAKFTVILTVGKYSEIVTYKDSGNYITVPFYNLNKKPSELLDQKSQEIISTNFLKNSFDEPLRFTFNSISRDTVYWLYESRFYKDNENLKADEVKALLHTRDRLRKARINRAKTIASTPEVPVDGLRRGFVPEDVRLLVWERDGGKCAKCGSRNELQFDHVIPFSLGGSSTADNLQILCGSCNRTKSNSIA